MVNGILFVDKDEGWTSHDAVAKARRVLETRKVGHAGTLDPMATGLLTLGVGSATRLLTHMVGLDKTYTATMRLGEATTSDDRMSEVTHVAPEELLTALTREDVNAAVQELTGRIEQVPSAVSAIKVNGKRAYDRVRSGEQVELKARPVVIHVFDVHELRHSTGASGTPVIDLAVTVQCSSGTYVRALARDLGEKLGVGGHLTRLRRTAVGPFALPDHIHSREHAQSVSERCFRVHAVSTAALAEGRGSASLVAPASVARELFATLELDAQQAADLAHGKSLEVDHPDAGVVAAIAPDGRLVGLVSVTRGRTRVVTNFPVSQGGEGKK